MPGIRDYLRNEFNEARNTVRRSVPTRRGGGSFAQFLDFVTEPFIPGDFVDANTGQFANPLRGLFGSRENRPDAGNGSYGPPVSRAGYGNGSSLPGWMNPGNARVPQAPHVPQVSLSNMWSDPNAWGPPETMAGPGLGMNRIAGGPGSAPRQMTPSSGAGRMGGAVIASGQAAVDMARNIGGGSGGLRMRSVLDSQRRMA